MSKRIPLEGLQYGRLKIVKYLGDKKYECLCQCGTTSYASSSNIRRGNTSSCGCYRKEVAAETTKVRSTTHGKSKTPEYRSWRNMQRRCYDKNCSQYVNYGGRGIKVCDKWFKNFPAFLENVGLRPSAKHSLDRINNDGNYEPNNVRWTSSSEQAKNRREFILRANDVSTMWQELELYRERFGPVT